MASRFPLFPVLAARLLEPLPLAPASLALGAVVRRVAAQNPRLFGRLGAHAGKRFLIEPTDLPVAFLLCPVPGQPMIRAVRRNRPIDRDCRIAGPLSALLALVHGAEDGDALFFSRDIIMEGDTEAALALRNALDDAEIDLFAEAAALFGGGGRTIADSLRPAVAAVGRLAGVALTRAGGLP